MFKFILELTLIYTIFLQCKSTKTCGWLIGGPNEPVNKLWYKKGIMPCLNDRNQSIIREIILNEIIVQELPS